MTKNLVEDVSVGVETIIALGTGVGQRSSGHGSLRKILLILAKQTKIVERTEPGINALVTDLETRIVVVGKVGKTLIGANTRELSSRILIIF